jgi:hypothetical protein
MTDAAILVFGSHIVELFRTDELQEAYWDVFGKWDHEDFAKLLQACTRFEQSFLLMASSMRKFLEIPTISRLSGNLLGLLETSQILYSEIKDVLMDVDFHKVEFVVQDWRLHHMKTRTLSNEVKGFIAAFHRCGDQLVDLHSSLTELCYSSTINEETLAITKASIAPKILRRQAKKWQDLEALLARNHNYGRMVDDCDALGQTLSQLPIDEIDQN